MALEVGQIVDGKYQIERLIGEGGMGAVYSGENLRIRRRVAIKVLHSATAQSSDVVQRFEREAQAAGRIGNDHILEVIDLGQLPDGDRYMVMEFLDGEALSSRIARLGRLAPVQAVGLVRQALEGLAAAHAAGIIHRDLKPDNLFILREKAGQLDYLKIIDFGISKFQPLGAEGSMTRTGAIMGTPYYMSPEQARGSREADHRSDLYAMGVILYEALSGRVPFEAETLNELLFKIVLSPHAPLSGVAPEVDDALASIVDKSLARDPDHRFQTAAEFIAALQAWESSGAAVELPPSFDPGAMMARIAGEGQAQSRRTPDGQSQLNRTPGGQSQPKRTPDTWASTRADTVPAGRPATPSAKSKAPIAVGVGVVVLGLAGVGAFVLRSPAAPAPAAQPALAASTSTAATAAAAAPPVVIVPVASASASASAAAPVEAPAARGASPAAAPVARGNGGPKATAAATPTAAPAPKKAASPGGGAPDFGY